MVTKDNITEIKMRPYGHNLLFEFFSGKFFKIWKYGHLFVHIGDI